MSGGEQTSLSVDVTEEAIVVESVEKLLISQLAEIGIKPLSDLSDQAQQLKYRDWEKSLSQGRRRSKDSQS